MQKFITLFSSHNNKRNLATMLAMMLGIMLSGLLPGSFKIIGILPTIFILPRMIWKSLPCKRSETGYTNFHNEEIKHLPEGWDFIRFVAFMLMVLFHQFDSLLGYHLGIFIMFSYLIAINCPYSLLMLDFKNEAEVLKVTGIDQNARVSKHTNTDHEPFFTLNPCHRYYYMNGNDKTNL